VHVAPAALRAVVIAQPARPADLDQVVHGRTQHAHGVSEIAPQQQPLLQRDLGVIRACNRKASAGQELRRIDLGGDLGHPDLHRHMLGDVERRVSKIALARPFHEIRVAAPREAEGGTQQGVGMDGDERRAIDRRGIDLGARRNRVAQRAERHAAVLRNEHTGELDRVRAGAPQAGAVPAVEHLEIRCRHQEQPHVRVVLARAMNETADHNPLRVADAARPRPLAVEAVAAGCGLGLSGGRRRRGDASIAVPAPDVMLSFVGEVREDAGMIAEIVQAPGRGAAGRAAKLNGDIERDLVIVLIAAPALRHDGADQAGIDVFLDRLARDVAIALGAKRALAQLRRQRPRALDQLLAARDGPRRRSGGRQKFNGTHVRLSLDQPAG
jgi:hypothetical protein